MGLLWLRGGWGRVAVLVLPQHEVEAGTEAGYEQGARHDPEDGGVVSGEEDQADHDHRYDQESATESQGLELAELSLLGGEFPDGDRVRVARRRPDLGLGVGVVDLDDPLCAGAVVDRIRGGSRGGHAFELDPVGLHQTRGHQAGHAHGELGRAFAHYPVGDVDLLCASGEDAGLDQVDVVHTGDGDFHLGVHGRRVRGVDRSEEPVGHLDLEYVLGADGLGSEVRDIVRIEPRIVESEVARHGCSLQDCVWFVRSRMNSLI